MSGQNRRAEPTEWEGAGDDGDPTMLKVPEVARYLRLGSTKTKQLVASGEIPSVRFGRAVRVPREQLMDWVASQVGQ